MVLFSVWRESSRNTRVSQIEVGRSRGVCEITGSLALPVLLRTKMSRFGLREAQDVLAANASVSPHVCSLNKHIIGECKIRLEDIDLGAKLDDLDRKRVQQVRWTLRERGLRETDSPISLMSLSPKTTAWLRDFLSLHHAVEGRMPIIGSGKVSWRWPPDGG